LKWFKLSAVWILAASAVCPLFLHWTAPAPSSFRTHAAIDLAYVAAALICYCFYRAEWRLGARRAVSLALLIFLLSTFVNKIHHVNVDLASSYVPSIPNEAFQEQLQNAVTRLSPYDVPHSYRFLPNALVFCLQLGGVRFDAARDIYRLLVGLVLFYAIYRLASLYTSFVGSLLGMLLVAAVYPISFENYIGQLTDPLSHLSFVLGFLFLETTDFAALLTALLIGSLAKETVLALAGFYAFFARRDKNHFAKAVILCAVSLAVYVLVRLIILHGAMHYGQVSGTTPAHIAENLRDRKWIELFFMTAGAYLPFLALGWRDTPPYLRNLVMFLVPVLLLSSLLFGWLAESRNYMPVVFVTAVITARFFCGPPPGTPPQ